MKALTLFSSRDRQAREIAEYLASELKELGAQADVANLHRTVEPDWQNYNSVVIGASVRYGYYHVAFQEFVRKYVIRLNSMPSAFYSVDPVTREPEKRTLQTSGYACKFLMSSSQRPDHSAVIASALLYSCYHWCDHVMIQLIMKMSGGETDTGKEVVYTDQEQVTRLARKIA